MTVWACESAPTRQPGSNQVRDLIRPCHRLRAHALPLEPSLLGSLALLLQGAPVRPMRLLSPKRCQVITEEGPISVTEDSLL